MGRVRQCQVGLGRCFAVGLWGRVTRKQKPCEWSGLFAVFIHIQQSNVLLLGGIVVGLIHHKTDEEFNCADDANDTVRGQLRIAD